MTPQQIRDYEYPGIYVNTDRTPETPMPIPYHGSPVHGAMAQREPDCATAACAGADYEGGALGAAISFSDGREYFKPVCPACMGWGGQHVPAACFGARPSPTNAWQPLHSNGREVVEAAEGFLPPEDDTSFQEGDARWTRHTVDIERNPMSFAAPEPRVPRRWPAVVGRFLFWTAAIAIIVAAWVAIIHDGSLQAEVASYVPSSQ
jgi:hypothetical protein